MHEELIQNSTLQQLIELLHKSEQTLMEAMEQRLQEENIGQGRDVPIRHTQLNDLKQAYLQLTKVELASYPPPSEEA